MSFATKPALARRMIGRALDAGLPCAWVLGDEIYGSDRRLRLDLERREQPFVLAIRSNEKLWAMLDGHLGQPAASRLAASLPARAWRRLSAGAGSKGERLYEWARLRLTRLQPPPWDHWLLVRRRRKDPQDLACHVVFGPDRTTLATLAQVAGRRWASEECFEVAKQEVGLADYEIRSWHGWSRYITLAMLAPAFLAAMRVKLNAATPHERGRRSRDPWSTSVRARSAISSAASSMLPA